MVCHKELPQAWWFDSHNKLARPSPWLNNTLSELDDKTKQMLELIDQDADSFAQRAEMYYKKRPVLVDMLGDLYRTHRSLAEQYDLLKHGSGTRHTVFGLSSSTHSRSQASSVNGKSTPRSSSCSASSTYDSESEVDDPELEEEEEQVELRLMRGDIIKMAPPSREPQQQQQQQKEQEQVEAMRAEIERLKAQNAALQSKAAEESAALRAELARKDEEKREVIRQLASAMDVMREENLTLREHISRGSNSKHSSSTPFRAFDLKKVAKDLFSATRLFTARGGKHTGRAMVAL